jgi:hypothetical protein
MDSSFFRILAEGDEDKGFMPDPDYVYEDTEISEEALEEIMDASIESVKALFYPDNEDCEEELRGDYFCEGRLIDWSPNNHSQLLDKHSSKGSLFRIAF